VGDINEPAMTSKDVLVIGSGSGESLIPVAIAKKAKQIGGKIIHIGSNSKSSLAPITDLMVRIPVQTKLYLSDEIVSKQPMSSLFEQSLFLFGDVVAVMIIDKKNIELKKLWHYHANLE
jgi:6-phospho-3-hexuloisomerase